MLANILLLLLIIGTCEFTNSHVHYIWVGESAMALMLLHVLSFPVQSASTLKVSLIIGNRTNMLRKIGVSLIIYRTWHLMYLLSICTKRPSELWDTDGMDTWRIILLEVRQMIYMLARVFTSLAQVSQMIFWTSFNYSIAWAVVYCSMECTIQCIRLYCLRYWDHSPHIEFFSNIAIITMVLCGLLSVISLTFLDKLQRMSWRWHYQLTHESERKHQSVLLLSTGVLGPVHAISQAVQSIASGLKVAENKAKTKQILRALNQVVRAIICTC